MTYAEHKKIKRIARRNGAHVKDTPAHDRDGKSVPLVIRLTVEKNR